MREGTMPMPEPDQGPSVHPSLIPANLSVDSCSQAQEGRTAVRPYVMTSVTNLQSDRSNDTLDGKKRRFATVLSIFVTAPRLGSNDPEATNSRKYSYG